MGWSVMLWTGEEWSGVVLKTFPPKGPHMYKRCVKVWM